MQNNNMKTYQQKTISKQIITTTILFITPTNIKK